MPSHLARSTLKITLPQPSAKRLSLSLPPPSPLSLVTQALGSLAWGLCLVLLLGWAVLGKERATLCRRGAGWAAPPPTGFPEGNKELEVYNHLFANYKKSQWPAQRPGEVLQVLVKLTLTNLNSLNAKEETLTTNVWITQEWVDYRLNFSKEEYNNVLRVPADMVWLPDIVLENNMDGNFKEAYSANVTFFPFEWQNWSLVFWSQTHNAQEMELWYCIDDETKKLADKVLINTKAFTGNGEWAIRHPLARRVLAPMDGLEAPGFSKIHYFLIIECKPLFYVINIIVPCMLISSLVVLVYFLPAQAGGQKCMVSISVLLAQTVFLFLITQKVTATSLTVPLIGDRYLLFVMTLATLIITNCVIVLNVSLRSPSTCLSPRLKHLFLKILLHYLGSTIRPQRSPQALCPRCSFSLLVMAEEYILKKARSEVLFKHQGRWHRLQRMTTALYKTLSSLAPEIKECVDACNFISRSTKEWNDTGAETENWVLIGQMIDKLCFWLAILLFTIGLAHHALPPGCLQG
uniref:Cholinergic receptor nicotinic epsilon subunit n=1 Tax=Naja naja TaxID=35670 RepID=A0A8C6XM76_NAJNA